MEDKVNMDSLVTILRSIESEGYKSQFKATDHGLKSLSTFKIFQPDEVKIKHFFRFEGESDPEDSAIVFAIETKDGERGTLIDSFGPYSEPLIDRFIEKVKEIQK
ncbi:MAG: hypothetical protein EYC69_14390 [Bacteroidetes bacterium]|nr:MAG: hypothetical protein EYC69_14390 [Bacteroidota bacterium]